MSVKTPQQVLGKTPPKPIPPQAASPTKIEFPPKSKRPCFRLYKLPFISNADLHIAGIYWHGVEKQKDCNGDTIEVLVDSRICSVLEVLAIVRTRSGRGHGYLIEFLPHGETRVRRKILSQATLLGRPEEALKALRDIGISVLQKHAKLVRDYLDSQHLRFSAERPQDFWESVDLVGWYSPECFVLPSEIIGNQNGVWFNLSGEPAQYEKRGHLTDWQQNVAALCVGNPYLLFAVSSSLSGPLLEPLNIQSIGNHLHGDSSTGKTTSQSDSR
jgi:putative DNA primase/helicase